MDFSLIIPCYNEEKNLPFLIKKVEKLLIKKSYEVLLIENGSLDNSRKVLKTFESKYENLRCIFLKKNKGYGGAIIEGLKKANGNFLSWTHADMQTNPLDLLKADEFIKNSNDKIFIKGLRKGRPFLDNFFTLGMSIFATLNLGHLFRDINAQPTIFHSSFFHTWDNPPNDFSLDLYTYFLAKKLNYKIYRFPVNFNKRLYGVSTWNINIKSKLKFIQKNMNYIKKLSNKK